MAARLTVTAPRHSYSGVPVWISAESLNVNIGDTFFVLRDTTSGRQYPAQISTSSGASLACLILDSLQVGNTLDCEILPRRDEQFPSVELVESESKIDILLGDALFTSYHFAGGIVRPFLYPVIGPKGAAVTRNFPTVPNVPGETNDHKHHRSIWVAFGDVNGADDWSEEEGCASILHRQFLEKTSGPVFARIRALNYWVANDGGKLLEEERRITVYNLTNTSRILDIDVIFYASEGDVRFGDTKEGGIVAVRVATSMDGNKGGLITNSFGGLTEAETWGKPAHWCDYSGPVDNNIVGIAIFDNPCNFRHPTPWHVRDYGLFAANPFALAAYSGNPARDGSYILPHGETLWFAYRIYIHEGSAETALVGQHYYGYINPPDISVE